MQNSNENTVEELKGKVLELTQMMDEKKNIESNCNSKKKKKGGTDDGGMLEYKLDAILEKIDMFKNILYKNELEKAKNQMLTDMDSKVDMLQEEFSKKIYNAKKMCEKTLLKYKTAREAEIDKLKQIIKDLHDEIHDYKSQVDSQDYKIELYKEKIIAYEKEKKAQTDHAELLRVLTQKISSYVDSISKPKNK